jgi:hypothetical protein
MKIPSLVLGSVAALMLIPMSASAIQEQTSSSVPVVPPLAPPPGSAVLPSLSSPAAPTPGVGGMVDQVDKMVRARTDAQVIEAFIKNWTTPFSLNADEILHLHDLGAPTDVLTTLISRSEELQAQVSAPPDLVTTNLPPPAVLYPYPMESYPPASTSPYSYPAIPPSYSYPAYAYSSPSPYWAYPYSYYYSLYTLPFFPWPYYGYRGYYGYHGPGFYYGHPGFRGYYGGRYGYGGGHYGYGGGRFGFGGGRGRR